jgi:hypothetical protein
VWNFVVARDDLPENVAYELTRAMLSRQGEMVKAYAAASGVQAGNASGNTFMPFHPGAAKALKEAGAKL